MKKITQLNIHPLRKEIKNERPNYKNREVFKFVANAARQFNKYNKKKNVNKEKI